MRTVTLLILLAVPAFAGGADDARKLLEGGDASKAADAARKAATANPSDIDAWLVLADALFAMDQPADAWEALEPAIGKNPKEPRLSLKLGDAFVKLAEKEMRESNDAQSIINYYLDAERNYGEAFKKDPKCAAALYAAANLNHQMSMSSGIAGADERKANAKKLLDECLGIDKDYAKAHALQGYMLYLEGMELTRKKDDKDALPKYQAAEAKYALALKLGDDDVQDDVRYGHTLLAQGRDADATKAYLEGLKRHPRSDLPVSRGLYYVANRKETKPSWGNPKLAPLFEQATKEAPKSPVAWYYLGYGHFTAKKWPEALDAYQKALELWPGNASYTYQVGYVHELMGDEGKALDLYRKALEAFPDHPDATLRFQGLILAKRADVVRTEKLFEELIKLSPNDADIHNNYAFILRDWAENTKTATEKSPPAEVKRWLKRSGEVYEMAARIDYPDDRSRPGTPQIQSDTGLLFQYYPCNFDAAKAKLYFTRALELSDFAYRDAFDGLDRLCRQTNDWETLEKYAESVVGSMERNQAIAPVGGNAPEAIPNETPGLKARAEAALKLAQEKLRKS